MTINYFVRMVQNTHKRNGNAIETQEESYEQCSEALSALAGRNRILVSKIAQRISGETGNSAAALEELGIQLLPEILSAPEIRRLSNRTARIFCSLSQLDNSMREFAHTLPLASPIEPAAPVVVKRPEIMNGNGSLTGKLMRFIDANCLAVSEFVSETNSKATRVRVRQITISARDMAVRMGFEPDKAGELVETFLGIGDFRNDGIAVRFIWPQEVHNAGSKLQTSSTRMGPSPSETQALEDESFVNFVLKTKTAEILGFGRERVISILMGVPKITRGGKIYYALPQLIEALKSLCCFAEILIGKTEIDAAGFPLRTIHLPPERTKTFQEKISFFAKHKFLFELSPEEAEKGWAGVEAPELNRT